MTTLEVFAKTPPALSAATMWYVADLTEARGKHDPWPLINYLLSTVRTATRELERRVESTPAPKGEKAAIVREAVLKQAGEFRVRDIETECPGVGVDWIRTQFDQMKKSGEVACQGRGPAARWRVVRSE